MVSFDAKWGAPEPGTGGGVVTWSFARYAGAYVDFSRPITEDGFQSAVRRAFETWETVANINFVEVLDTGVAPVDILLGWSYIDGPWGIAGRAYSTWYKGVFDAVEIQFDEAENWVSSQTTGGGGISAFAVALHEIGHGLGLDHVSDETSIMNPFITVSTLSANDIRDISDIYGGAYPPGFDPLSYIASYDDLIRAFGADAAAGNQHWVQSGRFEGREVSFNPLEYIASYTDLTNALGTDQAASTLHYLNFGWREGRTTSFDGLEYIASYRDLMSAFGANDSPGALHFITTGRFEGRSATFDGLNYIASYGDLINAFGTNVSAGAAHWITSGFSEGRTTSFDALSYIASYVDLIRAFGANAGAGTSHWVANGYREGRSTSFDAAQYLASHDDLVRAFGPDETRALTHWLQFGASEGRAADSFDEAQYLANYADLQAAFGADLVAATGHYIQTGLKEGRTDAAIAPSSLAFSTAPDETPSGAPDFFAF